MKRLWWIFYGEWFVLYAPGKYSVNMTYSSAKNYCQLFGGQYYPSYKRYTV